MLPRLAYIVLPAVPIYSYLFIQFKFREGTDDLHRVERDGDDAQQQVVNVFRGVVLAAPVVRAFLNSMSCLKKVLWRNLFGIWTKELIVQDYYML